MYDEQVLNVICDMKYCSDVYGKEILEECDGLVEQTGIARAEDSTVSSTHCDFIFSTAHSIAL